MLKLNHNKLYKTYKNKNKKTKKNYRNRQQITECKQNLQIKWIKKN